MPNEKDIIYTKCIKSGRRIYYLDVKKDNRDELFLVVTESKRITDDNAAAISFEKHKIFLYPKDFDAFVDALNETLKFIQENNTSTEDSM